MYEVEDIEVCDFSSSEKEIETCLSTDTLRDYYTTIKKHPPATKEENLIMYQKAKNGDSLARDLLVKRNMRLVISYVNRKFHNLQSFQKHDLIQIGCIGLILAIDSFDEKKGSFSTWAMTYIKSEINRAIEDTGELIRRPSYFVKKRNQYIDYCRSLESSGSCATDEETMRELDISKDVLADLKIDDYRNPYSLAMQLYEESDITLEEMIPDTNKRVDENLSDDDFLAYLKGMLSPFEYYILYYQIFAEETLTQEEIANKFWVTKKWINNVKARVLNKLKRYIHNGEFVPANGERLESWSCVGNFKKGPIEPEYVVIYLFVRQLLSEKEKFLLKELWFSNRLRHMSYITSVLNESYEEVGNEIKILFQNVAEVLKDKRAEFSEFKGEIMSFMKGDILSIDLDIELDKLTRLGKKFVMGKRE